MRLAGVRLGLSIACCGTLVACATSQGNAALECGAGGAIAAVLLCKLAHHSDAECAKIGAGVGGIAAGGCYLYADRLAQRRKELAGHENELDAQIRFARGMNEDTEKLNTDLGNRVASVTRSTDQLVGRIQQGRVDQATLARERQARDQVVQKARDDVTANGQALAQVKAYRTRLSKPSPDLDVAIAKQQQLYDVARQQVELLAAQRARV